MSILTGDVESKATLLAVVGELKTQADALLNSALTGENAAVAAAAQQFHGLITDGEAKLAALLSQANEDVRKDIADLDGWTLDITIPQTAISIRLTKPK